MHSDICIAVGVCPDEEQGRILGSGQRKYCESDAPAVYREVTGLNQRQAE